MAQPAKPFTTVRQNPLPPTTPAQPLGSGYKNCNAASTQVNGSVGGIISPVRIPRAATVSFPGVERLGSDRSGTGQKAFEESSPGIDLEDAWYNINSIYNEL